MADIVTARHQARAVAISVGFAGEDVTDITVKVSEIARRILDRSEKGEIVVRAVTRESDRGITIVGYHDGLEESTMAITKWLGETSPR